MLRNEEKSTDSEVSASDYLKSNLFAHLSREERIRLYKQQKRKEIAEKFGISLEGQVELQTISNRTNSQPQRPLHKIEERKPVKESKIYIESSHKQINNGSSISSAPPIRRLVRQSNVPESLILYKAATEKSLPVKEVRDKPTKISVTSKVNEFEQMAKSGSKKVERTSSERIKNNNLSNSISEHIKKLYSMGHSAPTIQDMLYGHRLAENPPKDEEIRLEISRKKKVEEKLENNGKQQKYEKQINSKRRAKKLLKKSHSIGEDIRFVITRQ